MDINDMRDEMRRVAINCIKSMLGPTTRIFPDSWLEMFADLVLESQACTLDWIYEQIPRDKADEVIDEPIIDLRESIVLHTLALRHAQKNSFNPGTLRLPLTFGR